MAREIASIVSWSGRWLFGVSLRHRAVIFGSSICLFIVGPPLSAQQQKYQQDAIDRGAALYAANCAVCHAEGDGVQGVNLKTNEFRHSSTDEDLLGVIRNGIPGTAMPAHTNLASADVIALVAYIRTMRDYGSKPVKMGDPQKGKTLFESGGCTGCHRVNGKGSRVALDLSDVGSVRPPAYIARALLEPDATAAEVPGSRFVRAVKKDGTSIVGRRLNEDTFSIQLIDEHENLVSLEKSDLKSLTILKDSTMPSLKGKYTDDQISDLVAYLASLNPPRPPGGNGGGGGGGGRGGGAGGFGGGGGQAPEPGGHQ